MAARVVVIMVAVGILKMALVIRVCNFGRSEAMMTLLVTTINLQISDP